MERKHIPSIIVSILLIFMVGCAYFQDVKIPETPHGKYLSARMQFNKMLGQYLGYYEMATPEDQAKARENIDPIFESGAAALDAWKLGLEEGVPTDEQEQEMLKLKNQILQWVWTIFKRRM